MLLYEQNTIKMIHFSKLIVLVHVLSAIVWIGGMFFLSLVLFPALKKLEPGEKRTQAISLTANRFRKISWIAIVVLLITGILNVVNLGITWEMIMSAEFFSSQFGKILIIKVCLVLMMIILSASHDFVLGPRYTGLVRTQKPDRNILSEIERRRKITSWLARLNVLIAVLVVACAVMLS